MTSSENTPVAATPRPAVAALVKTLDQEREAVGRLGEALARQLDALSTHRHEDLMNATDDAGRSTSELHRLQAVRERQTRLLARVLGLDEANPGSGSGQALKSAADALAERDGSLAERLHAAREALRVDAQATQARSDELAFALHVAVHVGRDVLHAWQHLGAETSTPVYTSRGETSDATPTRSFVNHLG